MQHREPAHNTSLRRKQISIDLSYSYATYCSRVHYHLEVEHGPSFLVPLSPLDMVGQIHRGTMPAAAVPIVAPLPPVSPIASKVACRIVI